jgi:uncharacterized membrane protein
LPNIVSADECSAGEERRRQRSTSRTCCVGARWDQVSLAVIAMVSFDRPLRSSQETRHAPLPAVRRIEFADLRDVLVKGLDDFEECKSDVIFLCLVYPLIGIALAWLAYGSQMLPLLFPLASGFALVGPVLGVGLYEMSRRREQEGMSVDWIDVFGIVRAPGFGAILSLGLILLAIFLLWLLAAYQIFRLTLGPEPPSSITEFARDTFATSAGWIMIVVQVGVGFFFAAFVFAISVISFPLLLDQDVGIYRAMGTSLRVVVANPVTMAVWGLIVAGGLAIGFMLVFAGLLVVMPVLGHATWHLYRKVVI